MNALRASHAAQVSAFTKGKPPARSEAIDVTAPEVVVNSSITAAHSQGVASTTQTTSNHRLHTTANSSSIAADVAQALLDSSAKISKVHSFFFFIVSYD